MFVIDKLTMNWYIVLFAESLFSAVLNIWRVQSMALGKGALKNLRAKKTAVLDEFKRQEEALAVELRGVVPEGLNAWLEEDGNGVIANLFEYGEASRKYHASQEDGETYGYKSLKEFAAWLKQLQAAWQGVVEIKTAGSVGGHRLDVRFIVV
jgi:hypothetical protein